MVQAHGGILRPPKNQNPPSTTTSDQPAIISPSPASSTQPLITKPITQSTEVSSSTQPSTIVEQIPKPVASVTPIIQSNQDLSIKLPSSSIVIETEKLKDTIPITIPSDNSVTVSSKDSVVPIISISEKELTKREQEKGPETISLEMKTPEMVKETVKGPIILTNESIQKEILIAKNEKLSEIKQNNETKKDDNENNNTLKMGLSKRVYSNYKKVNASVPSQYLGVVANELGVERTMFWNLPQCRYDGGNNVSILQNGMLTVRFSSDSTMCTIRMNQEICATSPFHGAPLEILALPGDILSITHPNNNKNVQSLLVLEFNPKTTIAKETAPIHAPILPSKQNHPIQYSLPSMPNLPSSILQRK